MPGVQECAHGFGAKHPREIAPLLFGDDIEYVSVKRSFVDALVLGGQR